jgi:dienelactone hydrolase
MSDLTVAFSTPLGERLASVRMPPHPCPKPGLLITLGGPRQQMMEQPQYRMIGDILSAAGYVVASIDLPRHGADARPDERELKGMGIALGKGEDVFAEFRQLGRALVDHAIAQSWCRPGRIVVFGVSRGGLSGLHLMAHDERIDAAAIHAPVTHLPTLREFADQEGQDLAMNNSALALVPRLVDRAVFVSIGRTDPRISELKCMEFVLALQSESVNLPPELYAAPGETHGKGTCDTESAYHAAAAFLLRRLAEAGRRHER